jgi:hypothetical protein
MVDVLPEWAKEARWWPALAADNGSDGSGSGRHFDFDVVDEQDRTNSYTCGLKVRTSIGFFCLCRQNRDWGQNPSEFGVSKVRTPNSDRFLGCCGHGLMLLEVACFRL